MATTEAEQGQHNRAVRERNAASAFVREFIDYAESGEGARLPERLYKAAREIEPDYCSTCQGLGRVGDAECWRCQPATPEQHETLAALGCEVRS